MAEAQSGDRVDIRTVHGNQQGILIESSEPGIVLLKLVSGYNIGIKKEDIVEISVLAEKKEEKKKELKIKTNKNKKSIDIVMTGGTISSRVDYKTGGVSWLTSPEQLLEMYPEIFEICNIRKIKIPFMKASENMDYLDWKEIAKCCEESLNDKEVEGVIITHGTDFLHYTSAALAFFLRNLNKPVVLTYSQRSIDRASSDANLNLQCSALAAISDIAEVMLVGHGSMNDNFCYAMPGTKVRKMHSSRRDAFKVVNSEPFAKISSQDIILMSNYNKRNKNKVKADAKFEEKVALVKIYPGQDPDLLDYYLKKKYKGIVLEACGLGHVPTKRARNGWTKKLKEIQDKGVIVCFASQTIYGRLDPWVYSNGRELLETGVIYLEDMLSETAFVKLGWVLGHKKWASSKEKIKEKMLENFSHEINDRLEK